MKDNLFLLKPGFSKGEIGPFYCSDSVAVEGMLSFFPPLRAALDIHYIDFPRPRDALIALLGEEQQSAPVLIISHDRAIKDAKVIPGVANGRRFLNDERAIRDYLSSQYNVPRTS